MKLANFGSRTVGVLFEILGESHTTRVESQDTPNMQSRWSIVLMIAFAFAALSLQGCGCDKEAAKKCMEEKIAEMTSAVSGTTDAAKAKEALCKALNEFVKCITDNSCCDEEEDGQKMKDAVNAMVESYKTYGCDMSEKCE